MLLDPSAACIRPLIGALCNSTHGRLKGHAGANMHQALEQLIAGLAAMWLQLESNRSKAATLGGNQAWHHSLRALRAKSRTCQQNAHRPEDIHTADHIYCKRRSVVYASNMKYRCGQGKASSCNDGMSRSIVCIYASRRTAMHGHA
jgi:hypothetical protein